MNLTNYKKKRRAFTLCALLTICICNVYVSSGQTVARFPYFINLSSPSGSVPNGIYAPYPIEPGSNNSLIFDSKGARLTQNGQNNQFSVFSIEELQFDASNGLVIDFDFDMFGGPWQQAGDGLVCFLYDALKPLTVGASGGAMGYAYKGFNDWSKGHGGLDGAYLGVGIDIVGNFRKRETNDGHKYSGLTDSQDGKMENMNNITVRGAMHPTGLQYTSPAGRGLRFSGYPVLFTTALGKAQNNMVNDQGRILRDDNSGYYDNHYRGGLGNVDLYPRITNAVTKLKITLIPHPQGGYNLSIDYYQMDPYGTQYPANGWYKILENYHYKESLNYWENVDSTPGTLRTLDASIPSNFKIGFSGGTGSNHQDCYIENIKVDIPLGPIMGNDNATYCLTGSRSITVKVYENDALYNGPLYSSNDPNSLTTNSGNTPEYIDYYSFRFEDSQGNTFSDPNPYIHTVTGVGTWRYYPTTGDVVFTAANGYEGTANIWYSVKGPEGAAANGGPFGQDFYRSGSTRITVQAEECNDGKGKINGSSINPHIQFRSYPRY